jgi:hypothetical protein
VDASSEVTSRPLKPVSPALAPPTLSTDFPFDELNPET